MNKRSSPLSEIKLGDSASNGVLVSFSAAGYDMLSASLVAPLPFSAFRRPMRKNAANPAGDLGLQTELGWSSGGVFQPGRCGELVTGVVGTTDGTGTRRPVELDRDPIEGEVRTTGGIDTESGAYGGRGSIGGDARELALSEGESTGVPVACEICSE